MGRKLGEKNGKKLCALALFAGLFPLALVSGCSYFSSDKPEIPDPAKPQQPELTDAWYNTPGIRKIWGDFEKPTNLTFTDEQQIRTLRVRGEYLVKNVAACGMCHAKAGDPEAPLIGGRMMLDRFGLVHSANITPDDETGIGKWNVVEVVRAIRAAIDNEGRPLSLDLHGGYRWMSDNDAKAIATYVLTQEPVTNKVEHRHLGGFERNTWGIFPQHQEFSGYVPELNRGENKRYGRYLAQHVAGCGNCHTAGGALSSSTPFAGENGAGISGTGPLTALFNLLTSFGEKKPGTEEQIGPLLSEEGKKELFGSASVSDENATESSTTSADGEPSGDKYVQAIQSGKFPIAGPDIRGGESSGLGVWEVQAIVDYLSTGKNPDGISKDGRFCPWPYYSKMADEDKRAIADYLKSL